MRAVTRRAAQATRKRMTDPPRESTTHFRGSVFFVVGSALIDPASVALHTGPRSLLCCGGHFFGESSPKRARPCYGLRVQHQDKQATPLPADVEAILTKVADEMSRVTDVHQDPNACRNLDDAQHAADLRKSLARIFGEAADRLRGVDVDAIEITERGWTRIEDGTNGFRVLTIEGDFTLWGDTGSYRIRIASDRAAGALACLRKAVDQ